MSDYETGYRKPPKAHQFKKGNPSANPNGRPKGRKANNLQQELDRKVVVATRNGRQVKKSLREVLHRQLIKDAIDGDNNARSAILRHEADLEKAAAFAKRSKAQHYPDHFPPPEQARRELADWLGDEPGSIYPHIAEAERLGILERVSGAHRVAPWAVGAAEARRRQADASDQEANLDPAADRCPT